jgi:hypothetical protein
MTSFTSILTKLRPELLKLGAEVSNSRGLFDSVSHQLASIVSKIDPLLSGGKVSGGAIPQSLDLSALALKIAYVSALQGAVKKAMATPHFNVETAINDLWIQLDSVRKLNVQPGQALDLALLRIPHENQRQLFEALGEMLKAHSELMHGVVKNTR